MTETNHGSNVKGIETTATYNHENEHLLFIHHEKAKKNTLVCCCTRTNGYGFAKLIIGETDYGVNAFLVPLRDTNSKILQGITIGDCGLKWDLTALIMVQLVSKCDYSKRKYARPFSSVNEKEFESPIPSDNKRFLPCWEL
jgi:acyl-CoA oxidase